MLGPIQERICMGQENWVQIYLNSEQAAEATVSTGLDQALLDELERRAEGEIDEN